MHWRRRGAAEAAWLVAASLTALAAVGAPHTHAAATVPALAFASEGHIWTSAADGNGAVDVTPDVIPETGSDGEPQPAWSSDGKRIVFVSTRDWVATGPGSKAVLQELYAVPVGGGEARRVTSDGLAHGKQAPAWSADGRWIAYVAFSSASGQGRELWVVRPDGSEQHRLAGSLPYVMGSPGFGFAWSPGGRAVLAYGRNAVDAGSWSVEAIDVDAGTERTIGAGPGELAALAWASNGRQIAVSVGDPARPELRRIAIVDVGSGAQSSVPLDLFAPYALSWSPDGSRFAVTGWPNPERPAQVYVVDATSGRTGSITGFPDGRETAIPSASNATWWPTGDRLLFVREARRPPYPFVVASINADGTCEQELSPGGHAITGLPVWRPGATVPAGRARCADLWVLTGQSSPAWLVGKGGAARPVGRGTPGRFPVEIWNVGVDRAAGVVVTVDGRESGDRPGVRLVSGGGGLECPVGTLPVRCSAPAIAAGKALRGWVDVAFARQGARWFTFTAAFQGNDGTPWNDGGSENVVVLRCRRVGTVGADHFAGTATADSYCGFRGNDVVRGGAGRDVLDGGSGADVLMGGSGRDAVVGGDGDDRILVRDGERDIVDCGSGRDLVVADRIDVIRRCEEVRWQGVSGQA